MFKKYPFFIMEQFLLENQKVIGFALLNHVTLFHPIRSKIHPDSFTDVFPRFASVPDIHFEL